MSFLKYVVIITVATSTMVACSKFEVKKSESNVTVTPGGTAYTLSVYQASSSVLGSPSDDSSRIDYKIRDEYNSIEGSSVIAGLGSDRITKDGNGQTYSIETKCWMQNCAYFGVMVTRVNTLSRKQVLYRFYSPTRGQAVAPYQVETDTNYSDINSALNPAIPMP